METIGYQIVVTTILEEKASRYFCTADENLLVAEENGCIRKTSDHETPKFCGKNKSEELHIVEVKYDAMGNLTCVLDMDGYEYALTVRSPAIRRVVERWAYKNLMTSAETGKLFADMMLCKSMADFILW